MPNLATLVAISSGFILAGAHLSNTNLLATSLIIDLSLAPLTAVIAARHGRSIALWIVLGLAFGAWALMWILLCGRRRPKAARPVTPEAA